MFKLRLIPFTLFLITGCVNGQDITLFEYRQQDSKTECINGLISDIDTVVFKGQLNYTQDSSMKYVQIYIQKKSDQIPLLYEVLNIQEDCDTETGRKSLCEISDEFIVNITIRVAAASNFTGAIISAKLVTSQAPGVSSNEIVFPRIMDSNDTNGWLIINENNISFINSTGCDTTVSDTSLNLTFICQSAIQPCLVEIKTTANDQPIVGTDHATYKLETITRDINVTIKYAACTLRGKNNILQCKIREEPKTESHSGNTILIVAVITGLMSVFIIVFLIIYWRCIKARCQEGSKTTDNTDATQMTQTPLLDPPCNSTSKHRRDYKCKKNSDHRKFYSLKDFKMDCLHKDYQDLEIIELIKCIADLTTRVHVKHTSDNRRNCEPKSDGMNLNYVIKEKSAHRSKTGMVIRVIQYSDNPTTCPCEKCTEKGEHSMSWGIVLVLTASTVVYDNTEAEHSSFDLFYDTATSEISTLKGRRINEIGLSEGWCEVECVTCDLKLLAKLHQMTIKCQEQIKRVNSKFYKPGHTRSFTCIVSHPHGYPKRVTVGYWKERVVVSHDENNCHTKYQYTTRTCPGSAGAFVYIIGVSDISEKHYHVHISSECERCNYCSTGTERLSLENKG